MKKDIARRWVDALRSGKYEQTTGALAEEYEFTGKIGYCCLGVLCELAVEDNVIPPKDKPSSSAWATMFQFDGDTAIPPTAVLEWAGIPVSQKYNEGFMVDLTRAAAQRLAEAEELEEVPEKGHLPGLNDKAGLNFSEIADLIEMTHLND